MGNKNKVVTITLSFEIKPDELEKKDFLEFKNAIDSGKMQREMAQNICVKGDETFKPQKVKATIQIKDKC